MDPRFSIAQQEVYWNDWVTRSRSWEANPDNARRAHHVLRTVNSHARPGAKLLEVGCGTGWMALKLARAYRVTATDLASDAMTDLRRNQPHVEWIAGDFLQIALPDAVFDVVVCMETLSHVPDQEGVAARIAAVTVPGGVLILTTQNGTIWRYDSRLQPPRPGQVRNWQTRERLRQLFAPYFSLEPIRTCAPGGDRGPLRLVHNRLVHRAANAIVGEAAWASVRERIGIGLSLVLVGVRRAT